MKALEHKFAVIWEHTNFERKHPYKQVQIISCADGYVLVEQLEWVTTAPMFYSLYPLSDVQTEGWTLFDKYEDLSLYLSSHFPIKQ